MARGDLKTMKGDVHTGDQKQRSDPKVNAKLEEFVDRYGPWLERTVRRLCPSHLGIDPDEVRQQVLLRLWKAIESEKVIAQPTSYLYRVISTVTIDAIRTTQRRRESSLENDRLPAGSDPTETPMLAPSHRETAPGPHRIAASGEIRSELRTALSRLSENRRRAVTLQLRGFTTPESARLLGWSEAKVRNLAWRGLQDLKEILRQAGFGSPPETE